MGVHRSTAASIGCLLALVTAAAGCSTAPSAAAPDHAAARAALQAVRSARCPAASPAHAAGDVSGSGSLEPLVPKRLLLCGYSTVHLNGRPRTATAHALVTDTATLTRIRTSLNKLGPPPGGTVNCPNDTGSHVLEIFTDGAHEVELVQTMSGCEEVSDGSRVGWVGTSDLRAAVMELLLPPSAPPGV